MRFFPLVLLLAALVGLAACDNADPDADLFTPEQTEVREAPAEPASVAPDAYVETDTGLKYYDVEEGDGEEIEAGDVASVHYTGWLRADTTVFDSSLPRGETFVFRVGAGRVIPGWDQGVVGMREGGVRQLVIPPALAYGSQGSGPIPPDATLIFDVELREIR